jgi:hypothetical protein
MSGDGWSQISHGYCERSQTSKGEGDNNPCGDGLKLLTSVGTHTYLNVCEGGYL